jgi:hypothetical protein
VGQLKTLLCFLREGDFQEIKVINNPTLYQIGDTGPEIQGEVFYDCVCPVLKRVMKNDPLLNSRFLFVL